MLHVLLSLAALAAGYESPGFQPMHLERVPVRTVSGAGRSFSTTRPIHFVAVPFVFAGDDTIYNTKQLAATFEGPGTDISVHDFYDQQSRGGVSLDFKVLPWRKTTLTRSQCSSGNSDFGTCFIRLMRDAMNAVSAAGIAPSSLDNDGDGNIDGLLVVYDGSETEVTGSASDPFCARYSSGSIDTTVDGKRLYQALYLPETEEGRILSPGTPSHEIGHILGLPDLYDDNNEIGGKDGGVGTWDLMSHGAQGASWDYVHNYYPRWKPTGFSAFCRARLGWISPDTIRTEGEVRLSPGQSTVLWTDGFHATQYVMLENRDRSQADSVLPGPGLLAMRIRPANTMRLRSGVVHAVNGDSAQMGAMVMQASGKRSIQAFTNWFAALSDLYGQGADSLTANGPIPLVGVDGTPSDAWIRNVRVDGNDVVFQAHPAKRTGYCLAADHDTIGSISYSFRRFALLASLPVPKSGKIVGLFSSIPAVAGKVSTSIWDRREPYTRTPLVMVDDTGSNDNSIIVSKWKWLQNPVPVTAGQVLYVGQMTTARAGVASGSVGGSAQLNDADSAWISDSTGYCYLATYRPAIRLLIQSDSGSASVQDLRVVGSAMALRRLGARAIVSGAMPGESVQLSLIDLSGRRIWDARATADSRGTASAILPQEGNGAVLLEATRTGGEKTRILTVR